MRISLSMVEVIRVKCCSHINKCYLNRGLLTIMKVYNKYAELRNNNYKLRYRFLTVTGSSSETTNKFVSIVNQVCR